MAVYFFASTIDYCIIFAHGVTVSCKLYKIPSAPQMELGSFSIAESLLV